MTRIWKIITIIAHMVLSENGQFNTCGYICYEGTMSLENLMMQDSAEQHQKDMGGITL